jgi:hypothetical protein
MIERVQAPISVYAVYRHKNRFFCPAALIWSGEVHKVSRLGYHHSYRSGKILYHAFSVETDRMFFKVVLNTENLTWELQEISDGQTN